jgi:hypothetical protein
LRRISRLCTWSVESGLAAVGWLSLRCDGPLFPPHVLIRVLELYADLHISVWQFLDNFVER